MKMRRLIAIAPDGRTATRTTHRDYTHVVFYQQRENRAGQQFSDHNPTWHGSRKLAEKAARAMWGTIVEVQETTGRPGCTGGSDAEKDTPGEASQDR